MNVATTILLDTNVLVYAHDTRDWRKQGVAVALYDRLVRRDRAAISTQTLSEFFNAATRRLPDAMTAVEALRVLSDYARSCTVIPLTADAVLDAARAAPAPSISIWDAQIWAVARLNGIRYVLSEDWQDGRELDGVRFLNPFAPGFDVELLALD